MIVGSTSKLYSIIASMSTWIADVEEEMVLRIVAAIAIACNSMLKSVLVDILLAWRVGTRCDLLGFKTLLEEGMKAM